MQLMTWTLARLGSRLSLLFEPHQRRVRHSALGRFLDQPMDLMVGLVEPDGTERVLPLTTRGKALYNTEQFERLNSITFRGHSEQYRLRFEFNIHSVFYPQDEPLCLMPAFYLEMRVSPVQRVRWIKPAGPTPDSVKLFIRLARPDTQISASTGGDPDSAGRIDLAYRNALTPTDSPGSADAPAVAVTERILSLNPGCVADDDGRGLTLDLPVTKAGSGVKWRLVWGAHCGDPILAVGQHPAPANAPLRYNALWPDLDAVMEEAVRLRDDRLAHSRRFEKLVDQAPLSMAQRHLLHQSFQNFLANTFWCHQPGDAGDGESGDGESSGQADAADGGPDTFRQWFTVWNGDRHYHSTLGVGYSASLFYLTLWPRLLVMQLDQWAEHAKPDQDQSEPPAAYLGRDLGQGTRISGQAYPHDLPVETNSDFLLILQAYSHWTGDLAPLGRHAELVHRLAEHLIAADEQDCGFPTRGSANAIDDAGPALQYARKQMYLATKRIAALQAAADLLRRVEREEPAERCDATIARAVPLIEQQAWLGDHYAVCADPDATGIQDVWTGDALPFEKVPGWDAYSIYTANGLLLPAITAQPLLLDPERLATDLRNACRETLGQYGGAHTSAEPENVWVSQNLWRDCVGRYLGLTELPWAQRYWDLQVMGNTHDRSLGFIDSYLGNDLSFHPRGVVTFGYLLAYPRLVIDRLAEGGAAISVTPDRHYPQRWPLLALADWRACRAPVCVVDAQGQVTIECESDPITIRGGEETAGVVG